MKLPWLLILLVAASQALTAAEPRVYAVAMRDGIHLSTDVYGATAGEKKPVLLMRTPYNKRGPRATAERFAAADYVVVVQDSRGAFASEGSGVHFNNDDQDGFDTLIDRAPAWSNGKGDVSRTRAQ
jgi:putative CocE/NonD family hydrolase